MSGGLLQPQCCGPIDIIIMIQFIQTEMGKYFAVEDLAKMFCSMPTSTASQAIYLSVWYNTLSHEVLQHLWHHIQSFQINLNHMQLSLGAQVWHYTDDTLLSEGIHLTHSEHTNRELTKKGRGISYCLTVEWKVLPHQLKFGKLLGKPGLLNSWYC